MGWVPMSHMTRPTISLLLYFWPLASSLQCVCKMQPLCLGWMGAYLLMLLPSDTSSLAPLQSGLCGGLSSLGSHKCGIDCIDLWPMPFPGNS